MVIQAADDLVTFEEVAKKLRVEVETVDHWRRVGRKGRKLPCKKYGRKWLTTWAAVDELFAGSPSVQAPPRNRLVTASDRRARHGF